MEFAALVVGVILCIVGFVVAMRRRPSLEDGSSSEDVLDQQVASVKTSTPDSEQTTERQFFTGLQKSRGVLARSLQKLFGSGVNEDVLEELEEALLTADVGVRTSMALVELLREKGRSQSKPEELLDLLRQELLAILGPHDPLVISNENPHVILMIGVNGSGKTTTIGKLAHRLIQQGKTVMVAAGDTFRAGAIEQLQVWAERSGAQFISSSPGADPASVIHNALTAAKARGVDVVLCDTAGRLQAQQALMEELGKVVKVAQKVVPNAPHETLLVLDATIGQNALLQAEGFAKVAPISGVALTKLDGTAKGGVVLAVRKELGIPVRLVGLGEGKEDLRDFHPEMFVNALLNVEQDEEKE